MEEKKSMQTEFETQLLQSQVEVQEATLSALGKELHDNIGQLLSSTKMLLGVTERNLGIVPETLLTATKTLGQAIHELRSLSRTMSQEWLEQFNLIENITTEINRIQTMGGVTIHFRHPQKLPLNTEEQIILFRIVQEAFQNVVRHSEAKNIMITITCNEYMTMVIEDDGQGFKEGHGHEGMGILNMRHRSRILGGKIEWKSALPHGTRIQIQIPIKKEPL